MKKILLVLLCIVGLMGFAMAQNYQPPTDVLGAHNNHGRGCAGCHAPHGGSLGNGIAAKAAEPNTNYVALWGQDLTPLYGQTLAFGDKGSTTTTLPADLSGDSHLGGSDPRVGGLLLCLSCHDGNLATGSMMLNKVYETLPAGYGAASIPTLLGSSSDKFAYQNDHPVGENAEIGCGGTYDWDCTKAANGKIQMTGPNSSKFVTAYGWTVSTALYGGNQIVVCTTCHNQHVMNVYKGTVAGVNGYYKTYFGVRGPYDPGSANTNANATAQFCRQCHGAEANEMNNGTAGTTL